MVITDDPGRDFDAWDKAHQHCKCDRCGKEQPPDELFERDGELICFKCWWGDESWER